jgi:hypothetical protein
MTSTHKTDPAIVIIVFKGTVSPVYNEFYVVSLADLVKNIRRKLF